MQQYIGDFGFDFENDDVDGNHVGADNVDHIFARAKLSSHDLVQ